MTMKAAIISIGDELILGQTMDSNSAWLSAELVHRGCLPVYHKTVGDDLDAVAGAIREASTVADLVIASGGLGPTDDDVTREALSVALASPLVLDNDSLGVIQEFFHRIGREMPCRNRIQAMHPVGTRMLPNPWGTAPGIQAALGKARIYVFPGVPREMKSMFARYVVEWLDGTVSGCIATDSVCTFGAGESSVAEALGDLMARNRNPCVGTTVSGGEVTVRIRSEGGDPIASRRSCEATTEMVRQRLGPWVVATGGVGLVEATAELAVRLHKRVAVAESCTGGWVAKLLTDVAGASQFFVGGWTVYSNALKQSQLGVPRDLLERYGAVSEPVATAMATGALARSEADYAVAVTGIAGPDGGTTEKPVGTVWIALAYRSNGTVQTDCRRWVLPGDRDMVRMRAAKTAVDCLRQGLLKAAGQTA